MLKASLKWGGKKKVQHWNKNERAIAKNYNKIWLLKGQRTEGCLKIFSQDCILCTC